MLARPEPTLFSLARLVSSGAARLQPGRLEIARLGQRFSASIVQHYEDWEPFGRWRARKLGLRARAQPIDGAVRQPWLTWQPDA
jgi:hypothetical protein